MSVVCFHHFYLRANVRRVAKDRLEFEIVPLLFIECSCFDVFSSFDDVDAEARKKVGLCQTHDNLNP